MDVSSVVAVGVDDGKLPPRTAQPGAKSLLAAVKLRGPTIEEILLGRIAVDGLDATQVLIKLLKKRSFDAVFLSGVSFAGFNLIDAEAVFDSFGKPVIVVAERKPDNLAFKRALKLHFDDWAERWRIVKKLGRLYKVKIPPYETPVFFEVVGVDHVKAKRMIKGFSFFGKVPEPIRVAGLIARGLSDCRALDV